jgi:hypothetical protein
MDGRKHVIYCINNRSINNDPFAHDILIEREGLPLVPPGNGVQDGIDGNSVFPSHFSKRICIIVKVFDLFFGFVEQNEQIPVEFIVCIATRLRAKENDCLIG